jgi:hypothetical protein
MKQRLYILILAVMFCGASAVWAQSDSAADTSASTPEKTSDEAPQNHPPPLTENPPLSSLDLPSLEPHAAPLSYIQPGATVSESVDSNPTNGAAGGNSVSSVSRGLASLTLKRIWSHYDLGLEYAGGAAYYNIPGAGWKLLQEMDLNQKINWKRGQLSVRDSFSYLPEGNFGNAYGSEGSVNIASLGNTPFGSLLGGSVLGTLGLAPRIMNLSVVDVSEYLSPKSSVTALAGYAFTHFYGSDIATGTPFIGASQWSFQGGYNRLLTPRTQVALMYDYQGFNFSVSGSAFHTNVVQGMFGRRISGRMDLLLGAGPQFTSISNPCSLVDFAQGNAHCSINQSGALVGSIPQTKVGVAAIGRLRYRFTKTDMALSYERYTTSGSGLFAGAQSDIARLSVNRPLSRVWAAFADVGFARNERLQPLSDQQLSSCFAGLPGEPNNSGLPVCPGVDANTYSYGFIGGGVHRYIGHSFHAFMSYQFNELLFDHSYCGGLSECSRISNRHVVTFGLDWIPRPIRID